jgi:hypothetical protein
MNDENEYTIKTVVVNTDKSEDNSDEVYFGYESSSSISSSSIQNESTNNLIDLKTESNNENNEYVF